MDVPDVAAVLAGALLVGLVDAVVGGRAGVAVEDDLLVLVVEARERLFPHGLAVAPVAVEAPELLGRAEGGQAHAGKERVSYQQGKGAAVVDDLVGGLGRRDVDALRGAGRAPLVHERGVDAAHHEPEPADDVLEALVALVHGDGAVERAVGLGEVAQQRPLAAGDVVAAHVLLEVARRLDHVAQHGLGAQGEVARPGDLGAVLGEGRLEQVLEGLGPGDLLQALEALLVLDALGLHLGHRAVALGALLGAQDLAGVLERGLRHRDDVERVGLRLGVEQLERGKKERRERLVEREVVGQVDGGGEDHARLAVLARLLLARDDAGVHQSRDYLVGALMEGGLLGVRLRGVVHKLVNARHGVAALLDLGQDHGVRDLHAGAQRLGHGRFQALEGLLVPADEPLGRLLRLALLAGLLRVAAGLAQGAGVLDVVLGRLGDDAALGVEARAARAAHDLVELARVQVAHAAAVELGEGREHHGVDGHVDAHAERVRAADDGEKPLLGELLDEQAVARQHARVVDAHAAAEQPLERLAEGRGKARALDGLLDRLSLLLGADAVAREGLRGLERRVLREVHDVERRVARAQGELDRALERRVDELVGEGHRARGVGQHVDRAVGVVGQGLLDACGVAQGGAHEQELRVGQGEQRDLPGPAAVVVGVEVELVHGDDAHVAVLALAQGLVGQDLGRAADDGRLRVDGRVAGDHADVLLAEELDEVEELLADQGLDGGGVVGAAVGAHAHEGEAEGDHRLTGAGRGAQDQVVAGSEVEKRLLLVGPQLDAARLDPAEEELERLVGRDVGVGVGVRPGDEAAERAVAVRAVVDEPALVRVFEVLRGGVCCVCHGVPCVYGWGGFVCGLLF